MTESSLSDTPRPQGVAPDGLRWVSRRFLAAALPTFGLYLLLVGTRDPAELLLGALVAVLTVWVAWPHLALLDGVRVRPLLPWYVLRYLGSFLWALFKSNIDMARRVIAPSLPICPALVEVHTELRSPLGKLLLANSITLTPGTLTVDVRGDRLLIHWIDVTPGADLDAATRHIAAGFERHLQEFLS